MKTEIRNIIIGRNYKDKMNNQRTSWTRIGTLFIKTDETTGEVKIGGSFDALPAHGEGFIAVPRENRDQQQGNQNATAQPEQPEEIPTVQIDEEKDEVKIEDVPF